MSKPLLFTPLSMRDITVKNRIVVAPMHQYAAKQGFPTDWHLMNVGRFAVGGAGMVFVESTKVDRRGCGTVGDLGLWDDAMVPHFKRLSDFIKEHGSVSALQLGHSGRKARRFRPWEGGAPLEQAAAEAEGVDDWDAWELVAPAAVAAGKDPEPRALSRAEIQDLVEAWGKAAARAEAAGFDVLEIHGAHGYLIHQFLSPVANLRNDDYGGSEANRRRFAIEVTEAVRANWPDNKPLFLRLSVEDDSGWGPDDSVALSRIVKDKGVDVIDCSSGGMRGSPVVGTGPVGYGYQVPYAAKVRAEAEMMSMAVGLIVHADQAEQILQNGEADLIALAREFLHNPNWALDAAQKLGLDDAYDLMPSAYQFWLEKRDEAVAELIPSTQQSGISPNG
ncbi:MAG: NADH:flavin oxidoreductase/NADH oxidase [Rhodospirillaceae bacterium]|jgi:2,4-dienoyl-CoA reductase-like NADH-dependent reductase (Old Yellow Enzyme family)|nr:NADH:flavin oxidoreductase/NADH oxidase [Rhodospirillaceae bacterium]MBT5195258.1 NADH:flavin oxidoreductase/NADH oxidase [Rhodospirillaceae bacterium]MBT5895611.1 NADH:flavin oxidoreductase/NADH oxidase [Rhodospirillaceae bacterium]MBT6427640.1 NADH:flavin oxidoreductase/NADH oxidase [Rhodospirillaceae bacterium]